ncbi:transposable element Tcb2 transposase [Trichonephila clavipes]|uniref:Transposable element Tcb2 transposase n=1 Tax=Trichonephila clavipes TaxID=2585209 RepID=A0A8X6SZB3_TRICX|nr:transposable element Tcb2 transposase [Trichonephila clavipes]
MSAKGSTSYGCCDPKCPSARRLRIVREDTGAPNEGATCAWMVTNEAVGCMMEAGWSARRVARQLGRSDCVVRRCWYQWIREMSVTRRPSSGRPQQSSR